MQPLPHLLRSALDLILPARCPICGEMIGSDGQFCASCWGALHFITEPCCRICGRPFAHGRSDETLCAPCLHKPPEFDRLRAALIYDDVARTIVLKLKYGGKIGLARLIAHWLMRFLPEPEQRDQYLLIPVPLHRGRLWRRGFNQSQLIAKQLSLDSGIALCPDGLIRHRATPYLKGHNAKARAKILGQAISLHPKRGERIKDKHIILIDDVYTSGATSQACTKILRKSGAASVTILCWARILRDGEEANQFAKKDAIAG